MSAVHIVAVLISAVGIVGLAMCFRFRTRTLPSYEMFWAASMALLWLGIVQYSNVDQVSFPLLLVAACLAIIQCRAWSMLKLKIEP